GRGDPGEGVGAVRADLDRPAPVVAPVVRGVQVRLERPVRGGGSVYEVEGAGAVLRDGREVGGTAHAEAVRADVAVDEHVLPRGGGDRRVAGAGRRGLAHAHVD